MKNCANCGTENSDDKQTCGICGASLSGGVSQDLVGTGPGPEPGIQPVLKKPESINLWLTVLLQERLDPRRRIKRPLEGKKLFARIGSGYCLLFSSEDEQDKSKATWIRPQTLSRVDTRTIILETGYSNYGKLVFGFSTVADADAGETALREIMT